MKVSILFLLVWLAIFIGAAIVNRRDPAIVFLCMLIACLIGGSIYLEVAENA